MSDQPAALPENHSSLYATVAEINEQLLECLRSAALASPGEGMLTGMLRADWRRLDDAALRRMAACPYLLLDGGFREPLRWTSPGAAVSDVMPRGYFQDIGGVALLRQALLFGWHLARSNRLAARLMLAMSEPTASLIASCRMRDILTLAECGAPWIAPRWVRRPHVWQQLLQAACRNHPAQLRAVQLRGMQLLASAETALPTER